MTQATPRFCPNCGTPVPADQRFCSECGTAVNPDANSPTVSASRNQAYLQNLDEQNIPPPPPPGSLMQPPQQAPYAPYSSQSPSYYSSPTQQSAPALPDYARVQKRSPLRRLITFVSVLLILALLVGGGYLLLRSILGSNSKNTTSNNPGGQSTTAANGNATANSGQNGTATTGGVPLTGQEQLNLMVTYASDDWTVVSVQQANSFPDDTSATQPGVVRINIQEHNPTTHSANFLYSDVARLILPDGSTIVAPDNEQNAIGPDASISRTNWIDFPVSAKIELSKLILRLGTLSQNQMDIPLSPNADLSKYQPKTVNPNAKVQYAGLNWTVTTATASLSDNAKQADKGMRYIVVTLSIDNPTSHDFNAYWGDYIRLKSGNTTSSPTSDTSFPLNFPAGSAGTTGSVIFLMPQDSTSFTLILLAQNTSPPISQATANFHIQ